jgi:hypothetical protein
MKARTYDILIGLVVAVIVGVASVAWQRAHAVHYSIELPAIAPAQTAPTDAFLDKDWHPASATTEVRWISDDVFSHVGGHCYGRARDGSTRTADGKQGLAPIAEKFCIAFGAKDTPFDVPDKR